MEEEKKTSRVRYDRLREIELEMQGVWEQAPEQYQYADANPDYYNMSLEDKNDSKYMCTFPYPYMNGYLHLGHAFSMSKAEFQVRYQRQKGKNALFPFGFHCTGMPIQAAANRLKMEIEQGKTRSEAPKAVEASAPIWKSDVPATEAEIAAAKASVTEQGDIVKTLKSGAATKEEVDAAVAQLKFRKANLAAMEAPAGAKDEKPAEGGKKGKAKAGAKKDKVPEVVKVPPTQYEILLQIGIPESDIPQFQDAMHWLKFFPPKGQEDLKKFGVSADWRRSFITTNVNPFYDSFIRWQLNTLKEVGKCFYGKKYTIYSALDGQPCADHDRSTGEGVGAQEYVGIKLKLLEFPDSIKNFAGKNVYLVAATLRPETMYGQTNCFVLPGAEYGIYAMKNDEYFIMSERGAKNFAYQEVTVEYGKYPSLAKVTGDSLIGKALSAPLSHYEKVYALPMTTISMDKGTGIVTSVPSDSPDDWAALRDLQTKAAIREKYNVTEDMCVPFMPVPIINIPEFGDLTAVKLVEDLKIQSQKDTALLKQAKDKAYLKGFYEGKLLVGIAAGETVEKAKPIVKQHLFDQNLAIIYYEPEGPIISRTGDKCIVASCYQWFMNYGEDEWKEFVRSHLKSDEFKAYNTKTQHEFDIIIDWLKAWGCTRTQGLGTLLPWDDKFKVESLSDSTIYMAYYTVAGLLQGGVMDGSKVGPLGIEAKDLNDQCWDYIFKKGAYPAECKVSEENLAKMRFEFEYWYPMDLRVSGKDLIRNHLTMCLYNHAAIWEDPKMMPKSIYCNGYMVLNNEKMSKSTGNFLTLGDCIDKFGVDATRVTLADAGDGLDDANFDTDVANSMILKLFTFEKWIQDKIKENIPSGSVDFAASKAECGLWDSIFENTINGAIEKTTINYDEMKYKQVTKSAFFELQSIKEDYLIAKNGKANAFTFMRFLETQLILMNPIIPHYAQYCWSKYVYPVFKASTNYDHVVKENLVHCAWPKISAPYDKIAGDRLEFLKKSKSTIRDGLDKAKSGGKKGKAKKGAEPEAPKVFEKCIVFVAKEYPEFKKQCLTILQGFEFDKENKIVGDHIGAIRGAFDKKQAGLAMKFVSFQLDIALTDGKEAALRLESAFDEQECIELNQAFLFENMPTIKDIKIMVNTSDEAKAIEGTEQVRESAEPAKASVFFY